MVQALHSTTRNTTRLPSCLLWGGNTSRNMTMMLQPSGKVWPGDIRETGPGVCSCLSGTTITTPGCLVTLNSLSIPPAWHCCLLSAPVCQPVAGIPWKWDGTC